ncbi:MAG: cephalosporin hydroxylase [Deltaproteobacteria bacterium HGW-Deltaproteobacteria-8]|jgi:cephalosporin hydroxylase|nr:MAG: cephalosporin hydroxylase [Deltaproteobacteria bacterium HGW-Deltaproteobacteria-8]
MSEIKRFQTEKTANIAAQGRDPKMVQTGVDFVVDTAKYKYSYNFSWMGRPIIQFPQDMVAMQELIWAVRPEIIVETGIAHGGSLIYYASLLELMGGDAFVLGVDIDIREHNRAEIEKHPMAKRIQMLQGSAVDEDVARQVREIVGNRKALVVLDSNHTHEHVLRELDLYSPLVKAGSYLVVFDTVVEDMPDACFADRPWGKGDNPKTAVREFLARNDRFVVDLEIQNKLLITVAPEGYLKCIKD